MTIYQAYLRTAEWDEKRRQALYDARYRCERCGVAAPLQVHHLTYKNKYHERPEDLQALCFACHRWVHMAWWQKSAIIPFKVGKWFFKRVIGL